MGDARPFFEVKGGGGWWRIGKERRRCPAVGRATLEPGSAVRMLVKVMNMQMTPRAAAATPCLEGKGRFGSCRTLRLSLGHNTGVAFFWGINPEHCLQVVE